MSGILVRELSNLSHAKKEFNKIQKTNYHLIVQVNGCDRSETTNQNVFHMLNLMEALVPQSLDVTCNPSVEHESRPQNNAILSLNVLSCSKQLNTELYKVLHNTTKKLGIEQNVLQGRI